MIKITKKNIYSTLFLLVSGLFLSNTIVYGMNGGDEFEAFMPPPFGPDGIEIVGLSGEIDDLLEPDEQSVVLRLASPIQLQRPAQEDQDEQEGALDVIENIRGDFLEPDDQQLDEQFGLFAQLQELPETDYEKEEDSEEKEVAESAARPAKSIACQVPSCGKTFLQEWRFKKHMRTHTGEKSETVCKVCSKECKSPSLLARHIRTHTGEKPFACLAPGCGQRFSQTCNLINHMRIHTGEKPYTCEKCDRSFARSDSLRYHRC